MLNSDVVLVNRRQCHNRRPELRINVRWQREGAIRAHLYCRQRGWTLRQSKHVGESIVRGHVVPEGRAEDAQIIGPSIAASNDGFRSDLIGKSKTWRKVVPHHVLNSVRRNTTHPEHIYEIVREVVGSAVARSIHCFGEYLFPAQAKSQGPLRCRTPFILPVEEEALLLFLSVGAGAYVALEAADISQQERSQADAINLAAIGLHQLGGVVAKGQFTRAMAVARYAQIQCIAQIDTKLESVLAHGLSQVVDKLILPFGLSERAVALVRAQGVT